MTMQIKEQQPPFTIQVEPTEGCNLGCSFCGLRGMRLKGTKPWKFMSLETAKRIADEVKRVNWNSKIVFALHGEPTLNENLFNIIHIFRKRLPNSSFHMFTNAYGINRAKDVDEYVSKLFNAGLNDIVVDCYSKNGDWNFVKRLDENKDYLVHFKPGIPLLLRDSKKHRIVLLPPLLTDDKNKSTRRLANHAGAAGPLDHSFDNRRCAMPFREMTIRWDGNVNLCCDDFRGEYPIASIHERKIDDIWNDERYQAARVMLYNYSRNFKPCSGCNNVSMRVGFLPDREGKETLPSISKKVKQIAQSVANDNKPLASIIKRNWEIDEQFQ